jgi:hypothetical protein
MMTKTKALEDSMKKMARMEKADNQIPEIPQQSFIEANLQP